MQMNIYHLQCENDLAARGIYNQVADETHTAGGGALWLSLSHGAGPAFVVIALPSDIHLAFLEGAQPVASVDVDLIRGVDDQFVPPPHVVPVVEPAPEEGPDDQPASPAR